MSVVEVRHAICLNYHVPFQQEVCYRIIFTPYMYGAQINIKNSCKHVDVPCYSCYGSVMCSTIC